MQNHAVPKTAEPAAFLAVAEAAGLAGATVERHVVDLGVFSVADLVRWRLGTAQLAPFARALDAQASRRLEHLVRQLLGSDPSPLRRSILVLRAALPRPS